MVTDFCLNNYYEITPRSPFLPSLDRIDNEAGYTKENTRIIWLIENYARNIFSDSDVENFCRRKLGLI